MLARIWLLLAPGNGASAYVAPWLYMYFRFDNYNLLMVMVKVRLYYIPITFQSGTLVLTKEFGAMTKVIATLGGNGWESPPLMLKAHH